MNIILFEKDFFNGESGEGAWDEPPKSGVRVESGAEKTDGKERSSGNSEKTSIASEALLPYSDERADHIRRILKLEAGDVCAAGILDGPVGEIRVHSYEEEGIRLSWRRTGPPVGLYPLTLLIGYTRPISAKRILREAASLGVERIVFTGTETGEKSYRKANLWKEETRWRRFLIDGLQQAGGTVVPRVDHAASVRDALKLFEREGCLPAASSAKKEKRRSCSDSSAPPVPRNPHNRSTSNLLPLLLDNEIGEERLSALDLTAGGRVPSSPSADNEERKLSVVLAVGSERGWSEKERNLFIEKGFRPVSLGSRVLRSETACAAGIAVALSRMGFL